MTKPAILRSIGVIKGGHGLLGEVSVKPWDEDPKWVGRLSRVFVYKAKGPEEMAVEFSRKHGHSVILKFKDLADRNAAEKLKGFEIKAFESQLPAPAEDEFYVEQLIGLSVMSRDSGQQLGVIQDVLSSDAGEFLEVSAPNLQNPVLVPFQTVFVPNVDRTQAVVFVTGLDSLFQET